MAHVLATVGILGAFGAGAAPDLPYATESLGDADDAPFSVKATAGEIVLDVEIDTLLEAETDYYLVVNFWSAELTGELGEGYTPTQVDTAGTAGDQLTATDPKVVNVDPMVGEGTGFRFYRIVKSTLGDATTAGTAGEIIGGLVTAVSTTPVAAGSGSILAEGAVTRASRGDEGDNAGMYRVSLPSGTDLQIGTMVRLELGQMNLAVSEAGTYYGDLYIYDDRGDARVATLAKSPSDAPNTYLVHDQQKLFEVRSTIAAPDVTAMLATADVGYERTPTLDDDDNVVVSNGGPFRGFEGATQAEADVGVLAMIMLNTVEDSLPGMDNPGDQGFLDVSTGEAYDVAGNAGGASVVVKAAAGAFGFGNGAGQNLVGNRGEAPIMGDNPATEDVTETDHTIHGGGAPTAFRVATAETCTGGSALALYAPDADGDPARISPTSTSNPTFSAQATEGRATVTGDGPFYLCVNVSQNEIPIPVVGDDRELDGYKITVTPTGSSAATADANGGSIDRNGTTINITYLSTHEAYNQRLVIVNRGTREAEFWMDEFQTEAGTMVMESMIEGTVAAKSRMVVRVQGALKTSGMTRASGTLNLTAPEDEIDVMTIQVHPGTGQIDTTSY